MKLLDVISFNPATKHPKGVELPFIEMATLPISNRTIPTYQYREAKGSGSKFQNGDTLLARITPCLENGKGGKVQGLPGEGVGHGSTEFIVMRARKKAEEDFVYYLSRLPDFRTFAIHQMTGSSGRQRVNWQSLQDFEIPEFSHTERTSIGATLGALDDKIELNRQTNETLEAMARALFKDWFVDFGPTRAKMAGSKPYLAPDLWALFPDKLDDATGLPEGWGKRPLDKIAKQEKDSVNPQDDPDELFEHFSIPAFDSGSFPAMDVGAEIKSNKTLIPESAVLLSKLNPEIQRVWLPRAKGEYRQICSTEFLAYTPRRPFGRTYLYAAFSDRGFRDLLTGMVTGTSKSHQRVNATALAAQFITAPDQGPVHAFEEIASSLFDRVMHNQATSTTLASTRDLLLPKLMSGEIRLREAEQVAGEVL